MSIMTRSMSFLKVAEMRGTLMNYFVLPRLGSAPFLRRTQARALFCQCTAAYRAVPPDLSLQLISMPLSKRQRVALIALLILSVSDRSFLQGCVSLATSCALMRKLTVEKSLTCMLTGCVSVYQMKASTSPLASRSKAYLSCSVGLSFGFMQCLQALTRPFHLVLKSSILYYRWVRCEYNNVFSDWETIDY